MSSRLLVFLIPFAVIAIFSFAVFESFVYLIGKGAQNWGPAKQERRSSEMVDAARTSRTTVRRVGLDGREAATEQVPNEAAA